MCEVRAGLEAAAARALAGTITPEQLADLRRLAVAADRAEEFAEVRADWDRAEGAFHLRLLESAGNSRILHLLEHQGMLQCILSLPMKRWRPRCEAPRHLDIINALALGDADLCDRVVRAHTGVRRALVLESMSCDYIEIEN